jgi:drug/metabolite transporter (DMT)-like permease
LNLFFAFEACDKYGVNAGIATVVMPSNAIIVIVVSYCLYKESVLPLHFVGVFIIIGSVVLIVLTPPSKDDSTDVDAATTGQLMIVIMYSSLATLCLAIEVIVSKTLAMRGVRGMHVGFSFLFVEGLLGTLYLLGSFIGGNESAYALTLSEIGITALAGLTAFLAVTLLQVSVSIGAAGLALAIFNTNSVFLSFFAFVFLGGLLSAWQVVGITLTAVGATVLSLADNISAKFCAKKKESETIADAS